LCNLLYAQSPLGSGDTYKIAISANGVYKITFDHLKKLGINPSGVNPKNIRIFGDYSGMLPQSNDIEASYLSELSIFVSGEDDEKFDKNDFVLFYGQGPDRITFNERRSTFSYQNNFYTDKNFYFVTVSDSPGKRIDTSENVSGSYPIIDTFDDYAYHELDQVNILHSGREWYGEEFILTTSRTLSFKIPGIVPESPVKIVSDVMGQTYSAASMKLFMNGVQVVEQHILPIANSRYALKGQDKVDTVSVNESVIGAASRETQEIEYQFIKGSGYSQGYLDKFLLHVRRYLKLYGQQTIFTSQTSTNNAISQFHIQDVSNEIGIWDITDVLNPRAQSFQAVESTASFSTETISLKTFVAFNNNIPSPELIGRIQPQNLSAFPTPNLIIVTHPSFVSEAHRLAEHRQAFSNWTVEVVTTEEVFNEFSSGRQDVTAIRNFARLLNSKTPGTLKALLLFGKCSYDYKDRFDDNMNLVPTYESRNSLHPLQTYSSDDYYGFLEAGEGEWPENPAKNHTLDIGVGRLPATNLQEAKAIVDKIIKYDTDKKALGSWRKEIAFVADDGNSEDNFTSLHQFQANSLASLAEQIQPSVQSKKLFMGTYSKTIKPNGESVVQMTHDIERAFEKGALIINYTGHGSEEVWADERVVSREIINELRNQRYPFLVTATCEFGRHDDYILSSAENMISMAKGGCIGLVTTARPVNTSSNFNLNQAFYEALFTRSNGHYRCLADVVKDTKNNSWSGVSNRNFSLLGDPSLTLALPSNSVVVNSIQTETGSDTLKALSTVIVKGHVANPNGEKITTFNGSLEAVLFDKETNFVTVGRNNPPFNYKAWSSPLFSGKASVTQGDFEFKFILPKNISYQIAEGKLTLYAADASDHNDAIGYAGDFKIGGSEPASTQDNAPPLVKVFIGDTTFVDGGIASTNTLLVARLSDDSGINISNHGIGNVLSATLDGNETFILNDYYFSDLDDYRNGTISYPLKGLSPGPHTLTLKAWDTHNNPAEASIHFTITESENLVIESFGNYPNPFSDETRLFFTHNRAGDDLEAHLFIYTPAGNLLKSIQIPVAESGYKTDLITITNSEPDKKLPAGLYLARLVVRSLTNGSKNEQLTKLIVLN
jgi:hypothetical protein